MKWINVEDRLPKDDESVLVTNKKIEDMIHRAYYEEETNCFFSLECFHVPVEVTHWMKYPKQKEIK